MRITWEETDLAKLGPVARINGGPVFLIGNKCADYNDQFGLMNIHNNIIALADDKKELAKYLTDNNAKVY